MTKLTAVSSHTYISRLLCLSLQFDLLEPSQNEECQRMPKKVCYNNGTIGNASS